MKIRSAIPENGCLIYLRTEKAEKNKKQKTSVKHLRYRLIGGCVNKSLIRSRWLSSISTLQLSQDS